MGRITKVDNLIGVFKKFIKDLFASYSTPEEIKTSRDARNVEKWVKKTTTLYIVFTVLGLAIIPTSFLLFRFAGIPVSEIPVAVYILFMPVGLFLSLLTNWGYATIIVYFPKIVKDIFKAAKAGFKVGEECETTHVQVTHEYGNTYSVSTSTENKAFLFGYIFAVFQFVVWAFFCVYIGPFLTFKKIKGSKERLKQYKLAQE